MPEVKVGAFLRDPRHPPPRLIGSRPNPLAGDDRCDNLTPSPPATEDFVDAISGRRNTRCHPSNSRQTLLECGHKALKAQKVLCRQWEGLPLQDSIPNSIAIFGKAFLTGEPQQLMKSFSRSQEINAAFAKR